jgi:hypothetical protein
MTSQPPPAGAQPPPPERPQRSKRSTALRIAGVALGVGVVALALRPFVFGGSDRPLGLKPPGQSSARANWLPGEYQQAVAPCDAVSGKLLARLVPKARGDASSVDSGHSGICVWHIADHTLLVRIQLHTPGGPTGDQTATVLAGEDFASTRQGASAKGRPLDQAGLAPLAGLADESFGVYDTSPPTYDVGRVVLHKRNAVVDVQYQDSGRAPARAALQQAAVAVAEDVIKHFQ